MGEREAFLWKIKNGNLDEIKFMVEQEKEQINSEINGRYPLHFAADYGHSEVIDYLLTKGASINQPDKYGITPLLSAIYEGHVSCVKMLLEKGADKTLKAPTGESYIDAAETQEIKNLLK